LNGWAVCRKGLLQISALCVGEPVLQHHRQQSHADGKIQGVALRGNLYRYGICLNMMLARHQYPTPVVYESRALLPM
jgi:hypothetical protein